MFFVANHNKLRKVQIMNFEFDWRGALQAVLKALIPFLSGAIGGLLSGCLVYGTGAGVTF